MLYRLRGESGGEPGFDLKLKVVDAQSLNVTTTNVSDVPAPGRNTGGILDDGPATTLIQRNGLLCAAWEDRRSTFAIYSACSADNGASFSPNAPVSGANAEYPVIALAPDGTLYGTYTASDDARRNIVLRSSADRGATWGAPAQITNVGSPFEVAGRDLAVDAAGQLLLSWVNAGLSSNDIVLSTSVDKGANFSSIAPIEDGQGRYPTTSNPTRPKVVSSGEGANTKAHLVWEDDRNSHDEIWTVTAALDGIPPTAPANLQAQADDASIVLTWQPATDTSGVRGYRVYRSTAAGGPVGEIAPLLVGGTFYRDVGLTDGTTYFYAVAAVDVTGNTGPISNVASAAAQAGAGLPANGTLAYESGANIQLRDLVNGSERTIANADGPQYAADGQQLFFLSGDTILSRPPDGDQITPFAGPLTDIIEFDIASNKTAFATIAFRQFASVGAGGLCTVAEPRYFERAGQEKYVGTTELTNGIAVSADGGWIAYAYNGFCNAAAVGTVRPPSFCLVRTADGKETCVKGADYADPDFAPGNNWVVFSAPISGQPEIWRALVQDDGTLTNYTQLTRGPANRPARYPAFSTDGNWVAFARDADPSTGENFLLFVVRSDGYGLRALNVAGTNPAWLGGGGAPPPQGLSNKMHIPLAVKQ